MIGTHTHVPTADWKILPGGTAYMTDVGMCGDYDSVIGMEKDEPLRRSTTKIPSGRLEPARGTGDAFRACRRDRRPDRARPPHRAAQNGPRPSPGGGGFRRMSAVLTGRCFCGAIRFTASAEPFQVSWCHCKDCRRQTGAPAVVWAGFRTGEVAFEGTPKRRRSSGA